jgi:hypothetical protein
MFQRILRGANVINTEKNRFYKNIKIPNENGCMEWSKKTDRNGYVRFHTTDGPSLIHRYSYELHVGKIPDGICVLHRCDNRKCVAPDHLFLGTKSDNGIDRDQKNRQAKGETQGHSKLTTENVILIKHELKNGISAAKIARSFNVTRQAIGLIKRNINWRHIK